MSLILAVFSDYILQGRALLFLHLVNDAMKAGKVARASLGWCLCVKGSRSLSLTIDKTSSTISMQVVGFRNYHGLKWSCRAPSVRAVTASFSTLGEL
jgi:hypothetical protein